MGAVTPHSRNASARQPDPRAGHVGNRPLIPITELLPSDSALHLRGQTGAPEPAS